MKGYYFRDHFQIPGNSLGQYKMLQKGSKLVFFTDFFFVLHDSVSLKRIKQTKS